MSQDKKLDDLSKPCILLIPNVASWVIGDMARQIMTTLGAEFNFYFLPEEVANKRPDITRAILRNTDLVHCLNESGPAILFRHSMVSQPIVTWIHHVTEWSSDHQFSAQKSSEIVACTPKWRESIQRHVSDSLPVTVIRHGVDSVFFQRGPQNRNSLGIPEGAFTIGFIGNKGSDRDQNRKGIPTFLATAREISSRIKNLHVLFAGPGWESDIEKFRSAGISAGTLGFVRRSKIPEIYSNIDVYLMTATVEGGPCTVLESMSCETPVVATKVGLVPDLVKDGVNGFTAAVGDAGALAEGVLELARNPTKARVMGKAARDAVLPYSWASVLSPLAHIYNNLIRRNEKDCTLGPPWLLRSASLTGPAWAADCYLYVGRRIRSGALTLRQGLQMLPEMMYGVNTIDRLKGIAVINGLLYKGSLENHEHPDVRCAE
jgi:glycosyltransferase involved in cell wall biosynthesis